MVKAIKKFVKTMILSKNPSLARMLYSSIKTIRQRPNSHAKPPTIEQLRQYGVNYQQ
ncbi:MAG: hypothetical protein ACP5NQ_10130 [Vulcanisaeta sp.]